MSIVVQRLISPHRLPLTFSPIFQVQIPLFTAIYPGGKKKKKWGFGLELLIVDDRHWKHKT